MENRKIGIRFCGGCNSGYNRQKVVNRITAAFPDILFEHVNPRADYMAVLVVCGCPSACARTEDLSVPEDRLIYISCFADFLPAKTKIEAVCREEDDSEKPDSLNIGQILKILPHREPMLLINAVPRLKSGREITAVYKADPDHVAFQGHFPNNPIFPGVLTIEAMAQAAGIMMLTLEDYKGKQPLLFEIKKAKCRSMILPGMEMEIHASLVKERREIGMTEVRCQVFLGDKLASEAELTLMIR